eukprot:CAMPEP_0205813170 /NCGR_PEP_ID=MMETSP0205-20121125/17807_1 /ASSEMBLY_ACC=CAM_ASM_000278 /TAXON_ID=36767 /ORGANISM="Euplotes focardii, Strain TN1" /LENGTH=58 /DNA_ID=CAMNT_0053094947 /DNA_START=90 /DNA_END=266 /DNA_ORIENTATION=-
MAGYNAEDMNKEYKNLGGDIREMAYKFQGNFRDAMGEKNEMSDELEDELMHVAMFFDP